MPDFKPNQFHVRSEPKSGETRVLNLDLPEEVEVRTFEFGALKQPPKSGGNFQSFQNKTGQAPAPKDARFSINPLLRGPLGIEEEEQQRIEKTVNERLAQLSEEVTRQAHEAGYKAGLEQGHQEAYQRFQQEGDARLQRFESMVSECEVAKDQIFKANERFLMELVFRLSRMVLLRELETDQKFLLRLSKELVDQVGIRDNITLRLNPDDIQTAAMLKEGLEKSFGVLKNLQIIESDEVHGGGCILSTEWSSIDASLETQLNNLYKALIGGST